MPELVQVKAYCDPCFKVTGQYVEGEKFEGLRVGGPERDLIVCPEHAKPLQEAHDLIAEYGERPGKPARRGTPRSAVTEDRVPCPLCANEGNEVTVADRQNLSKHLRNVHDTGIREARAAGWDV